MSVQAPQRRITAPDIRARKGGEPIVALTSYHAHTARILDQHCDVILVGDSLGMVMHGMESTLPVTLEMMILQGRAVMRGSQRALVVVDNTFLSPVWQRPLELGADLVMIDPQYAPRYLAKPSAEEMVQLIAAAAKQANVDLIQRFALMRYWHDSEHMSFSEFTSPDQLHMNDWSYGCLATLIAGSLGEAATRNMASAQAAGAATTMAH